MDEIKSTEDDGKGYGGKGYIKGHIKRFSGEYGFITPDDTKLPNVFLHVSVLTFCRQDCPIKDDRVHFRYRTTPDGRLVACWIEILD